MTEDYMYYELTLDLLLNHPILFESIYTNMNQNYYWSHDWSTKFYIEACYAGFISVSSQFENTQLLFPEIQLSYAALDFDDLKISKKLKKILEAPEFLHKKYRISINTNLEAVLEQLNRYHLNNWLSGHYTDLIIDLKDCPVKPKDFNILSIELYQNEDNMLIAGEIGYAMGSVYTSLTGFCHKSEKKFSNFGTLQLACLAKILQKHGYSFWNLGHPYMKYKTDLGCKIYDRSPFLKKWIAARDLLLDNPLVSSKKYVYDCVDLMKSTLL